jgi:alpha,alpha-trehalase
LEYKSLSIVSRKTGRIQDAERFAEKAENLKKAILEKMWDKTHGTFYNINLKDKSFITVVSYSSVHPFWAGIATQEQADTFFKNYLLNPNKMLSPYGIRTQSKDHAGYNNVNMIKPYSNWQGPIWPIATYIYVQSLMNYGYEKEAREIAEKVIKLCIQDIQKSGGMHENYDAETGEPLAAPNFVSWNLLLVDVLNQIDRKENPFKITE